MKKILLLAIVALSMSLVAWGNKGEEKKAGEAKDQTENVEAKAAKPEDAQTEKPEAKAAEPEDATEVVKKIAQQFIDATVSGDKDAAFSLCLEPKDWAKAEKDFDDANKEFGRIKSMGANMEISGAKVEGDKAYVFVAFMMKDLKMGEIPMLIVKVNGEWKIDQEAEPDVTQLPED